MTKEQLRTYRKIKDEHRQIEQRLHALESRPERDEDILRPLVELYRVKLQRLTDAQIAIENAIEVLGFTERKLIRLRYLDGLPWHRVAVALGYCEQHVLRLHGEALLKLRRV